MVAKLPILKENKYKNQCIRAMESVDENFKIYEQLLKKRIRIYQLFKDKNKNKDISKLFRNLLIIY